MRMAMPSRSTAPGATGMSERHIPEAPERSAETPTRAPEPAPRGASRSHDHTRAHSWPLPALLAAGLALLPLFALRPIADPSPWLHLRIGRFLLEGHRFALPDPWGPFATKVYVPTQWLPS